MAMSGQGGTSKKPVFTSRQPRGSTQEIIQSPLMWFSSYSSALCGRNTQQIFCLLGTHKNRALLATRPSSVKYFSPSLTCQRAAKFHAMSKEPSAKGRTAEVGGWQTNSAGRPVSLHTFCIASSRAEDWSTIVTFAPCEAHQRLLIPETPVIPNEGASSTVRMS